MDTLTLTKENLEYYFLDKNLSMVECSEIFNVSKDTIYYWIKKFNLVKTPEQKAAVNSRAQRTSTNKNCTPINDLTSKISKEMFYDYFIVKNNTMEKCCSYFNIKSSDFYRLKKVYNIFKDQKSAAKISHETLNQELLSDVLKRVNVDEFIKYYITENHNTNETSAHFNLTNHNFLGFIKKYNIKKDKKSQVKLTLKTKSCESLDDLLERLDQKLFIDDYNKGLSFFELSDKYNIKSCVTFYQLLDYLKLEKRKNSSDSKPNYEFKSLLDKNNINYDREFYLYYELPRRHYFRYDFKINNTFVELNPTITHNTSVSPYSDNHISEISSDYHFKKSEKALQYGYRCIHVWDWDDQDKILDLINAHKEKIFAKNCEIRDVPKTEANKFLDEYHLQGSCNNQKIFLRLYHDNDLVQLITFGKPRYNSKYQYELLRLCSKSGYLIVGGSEKLFKYFINKYNPDSIISYCDFSKFSGGVYEKLGFKKLCLNKPSKHWFNVKTKIHITDNLLRQRGFDQLFKTNYGKGHRNDDLMLENGFLPIYNCGQITFSWIK